MTSKSFHRRPLPPDNIAFASPEGRVLLSESLAAGTAESFHALVAHLHTQAEPAWCGLGTLVTVLNALEIDPGRVWKGPWRFFGEELLVCCKALEVAASDGLTLAEVACLAECNGADATRVHATPEGEAAFREVLARSVRTPDGPFLVANYDRSVLGQTGTGHYSPIAAWHAPSDTALVLDVARFKYPPHWVPVGKLWRAMQSPDSETRAPRGYLLIGRATDASRSEGPEGLDALLAHLKSLGAPLCPMPPAHDAP
ncbi:MAG: phytochelatin synthase family protein [Deltaproteobacteria bacterium]|nr:phytochelatin synthase family protein [Deltaproteobacteria bacterium]